MSSQFIHSHTLSDFKMKKSNPKSTKNIKLPTIDTAYITFYDYERIKKMLLLHQTKNL